MSNYCGLGSDRSIPGFNRHTEVRRTDNRLESPLGLRQCAGLSELNVCLPLSFPPRGFFIRVLCLSLDVYTSLRFPCLISALSFKEHGRVGLRWKKRQFLVKRMRERKQRCKGSSRILQTMRKHFMSSRNIY